MGFGVPLDYWFRSELKALTADLLLAPTARCHAFLRPEAIQSLWDAHQHRQYDHSARLWALVMLELWLREWAGPAAPVQSSGFKVQGSDMQVEAGARGVP
jgi:asparagine synthase (glutamine-hydrolysing)